jgi:hypothetical protein
MMESKLPGKRLALTTLSDFCHEAMIEYIDFLKIDVESLDYHVLIGGQDIIQRTCRYCQIEVGIDAPLAHEKVSARHYYEFFSKNFALYLVRDERHPVCAEIPNLPVLAPYTSALRAAVERHLDNGYGPNLFAVRNGITSPSALRGLMGD